MFYITHYILYYRVVFKIFKHLNVHMFIRILYQYVSKGYIALSYYLNKII